jgi:hypothetical protein
MPDINTTVFIITLCSFIFGIILYIIFHMIYFAWHHKHVTKDKKFVDGSFYSILRNLKFKNK